MNKKKKIKELEERIEYLEERIEYLEEQMRVFKKDNEHKVPVLREPQVQDKWAIGRK